MPTDTERREVARRLLAVAKKLGPNMDAHEFAHYTADVLDVGESMTWHEMELLLADLIEPEPERTCHDTDYSRESITCSECGEITMNTLYFVDLDGGYRTVKSHRPRFCSSCGVRVIGEEAGDAD